MTGQEELGRPVEDLTEFLGEQKLETQEDVEEVALFVAELEGVLGIKVEEDAFEVHYPLKALQGLRDEIENPLFDHGFTSGGIRNGGRSGVYVRYESPM